MIFFTPEEIVDFNKAIAKIYSIEHGVINPDMVDSISKLPMRTVFNREIFPNIENKSKLSLIFKEVV